MNLCWFEKKCSFVCMQRMGMKKSPTMPRKSVISPEGMSGSHFAQADIKVKDKDARIVVMTPMVMLLLSRFVERNAIFKRRNGW